MIRYIISSPIYPLSCIKVWFWQEKALLAVVIDGNRFLLLLLQSNAHQRRSSVCQPIPKKTKATKTSEGVNCHDLKMFNNCGSSGGVSWENLLQLKSLALLKDSVLQSNLLELLSKFLAFQKVRIFQSNFLAFQEIWNRWCVYIRILRTHSQYRTAAG